MWKLIGNVFRGTVSRHLNIKRETPAGIVKIADLALKKSSSTFADPVGVANPSGRQPGADGFLRNDRKFLRQGMSSKVQVAGHARKAGAMRQLGDDHTQPFLYRNSKLVMLHRRNTDLDYQGNYDVPYLDQNANFDNRATLNKRSQKARVAKVAEKMPVELMPIIQSRSYAQMIADYSRSMEQERYKESSKQSPKGLLSKFVIDSMFPSLAKSDSARSSKGKISSSDSFSLMTRRYAQEPNFTLSDNKSRKSSPNVRTSQKRDYVAKHLQDLRVEETWGSRFLNNSPRLDFEREFNLDYKAIDRIEREKENITARWVQAIQPKKKAVPMNVNIDDSEMTARNEMLKIKTSADKIEIEIPILSHEPIGSVLEKKVSILNVQISARSHEDVAIQSKFTDCQTISCRCNSNSACNRSNCDDEGKPGSSKKEKEKSSTLKGLPWWASSECTCKTTKKVLKTTECLNEVYSKDQNVQVLATEDMSPCNNKVIKIVKPIDPRPSSSAGYRLRRRKKNSSIARVTKHIEEKLQKKKKMEANKEVEPKKEVGVNKPPVKKNEEPEKKSDVKEDDCKKNNDGSKQSKANEDGGHQLKSRVQEVSSAAYKPQQNVSVEQGAVKNYSKVSKLNVMAAEETALTKSEESNDDDLTNSRRKGKGTEYRSKRIPDVLKPIEKRDDGTLIDYGLKVPTRKPRLKRPSEKSKSLPPVEDKSPKKTISAPQNELLSLKTGIPVKIGSDIQQKHLSQTRSELPLTKPSLATSKPPSIEEEPNENLQEVQESTLPDKFKSKLPKLSSMGNFVSERLPDKSDDDLKMEQVQARNKVRERLGRAPIAEMSASAGDEDHNPEMLEVRNKIRQRLGLPLIAYDPTQGYSIVPRSESQLSLESDRSEKELIYSAWLNRFHTRKHDVLIK